MCAQKVKVKGTLLSLDMSNAKLSREKLLGIISMKGDFDCPSISTLRRAEAGGPIEIEMLEAIASGLNFRPSRYIETGEDLHAETLCKIGGAWEGYYIEYDIDRKLGLVSSEMNIVQHGAGLYINTTDIEAGTTDTERTEDTLEATIVRDLVMIKTRVTGWSPPFGVGYTLLKVSRSDEFMRGHTIWYDLDSEEINTSKCIYVKSESQYLELYLDRIREELEAEIMLRSTQT